MNRRKKLIALAAVVMMTAGAGAAVAQDQENAPTGAAPPAAGPRALGGTNREAVFTPIAPCRLVDTRSAGGKIGVGQQRAYDVRGTGATFAAQGGLGGGCGIPAAATAVEVTVTAAETDGSGFLRVFPGAEPNATFLNSTSTFNASNTGTVTICGATGGICVVNSDIRVKNYSAPTHVIIDVQGYFQQQMGAHVGSNGTLGRNSRGSSSERSGVGTYQVRFDRDISACVYSANIGTAAAGTANGFVSVQPEAADEQGVFVKTYNTDGVATDQPFYVTVTC